SATIRTRPDDAAPPGSSRTPELERPVTGAGPGTRCTASDRDSRSGLLGKAVRVALVEAVGRSYEVVGGTSITIGTRGAGRHPATWHLPGGATPTPGPMRIDAAPPRPVTRSDGSSDSWGRSRSAVDAPCGNLAPMTAAHGSPKLFGDDAAAMGERRDAKLDEVAFERCVIPSRRVLLRRFCRRSTTRCRSETRGRRFQPRSNSPPRCLG